jgi:DNA modification methylase
MQEENQLSRWISRLSELDWDYPGDQSDSKFSSLHFHPGRFISQIPAALIGRLSSKGDTILDPYCGSGTTVVEAQRMGRKSIGIDVNPISVLIAEAKTLRGRAARIRDLLNGHLNKLHKSMLESSSFAVSEKKSVPSNVQLKKWYHQNTGAELTFIWAYICTLNGSSKKLLQFCFSSILMPSCSESRHWGYVCDNTRPLQYRYVDAYKQFESAVLDLIAAYEYRDQSVLDTQIYPLPCVTMLPGDALHVLKSLSSESVDLIVTSPPYYGVIDYVKSQRLAMEWFGFDISSVRLQETGARSKRARLSAATEYIDEIRGVFIEASRVLKSEGFCCVVFGQSVRRESRLEELLAVLEEAGFVVVFKTSRAIGSGRKQTPHLLDEYLIVVQKMLGTSHN